MTPKELLEIGNLGDAVKELNNQVKAKPADTRLRVSLFELLCFEGAFDRAVKQLDVVAGQGEGTMQSELAIQVYRDLIAAERVRQQVFHDGALPKFLLTPPAYADRYVVLVKKLAKEPKEAATLLAEAEELFPALSGRVGDRAFASFRDADDRVAPMLEVFHGSSYLWLPLEQIKHLQVSEPKSLRDLMWVHARVETYEESIGDVFIPVLYVDTHSHRNDQVRLGRLTEWQALEDQLVYGAGQRVFLVDDQEIPLLELRDVRFDTPSDQAGAA
jgi:type VI secretion system protein ImpE